jgi:hypothetical protein
VSSESTADTIRRALAELRRNEDGRPAFLDGLLLGAMVGAAIAGSTLWSRWRSNRHGSRRARPVKPAKPGHSPEDA